VNIVFIVHYFPPVNSSGAKRVEAISKYLASYGHSITVLTTKKTASDGRFTEVYPKGVNVIELDGFGRRAASTENDGVFESMYTASPSLKRRFKDVVFQIFGQIPDPRLPFALAFLRPDLDVEVRSVLESADVVIGSAPPWPMLLAAVICKKRFGVPCVLDYRDHFSECHEMPGGAFAKWLELKFDRWLVAHADHVVAISEPMSSYYRGMVPKVTTIMNGYDHEVLDAAREQITVNESGVTIVRYMGIVSPGRVPHNVLKALVRLRESNLGAFDRLRFEFYGGADLIKAALSSAYPSIQAAFSFHDSVPYVESLKLVVSADYLLFSETSSQGTLSAQGILTTKLFEYLGSGRPIIADISSETLAGSFLVRASESHLVGAEPDYFLSAFLDENFYVRKEGFVSDFAKGLSRQAQANQYAEVVQLVRKG